MLEVMVLPLESILITVEWIFLYLNSTATGIFNNVWKDENLLQNF